MSFRKWLFKNGPGSPGHTARALMKLYNTYSLHQDLSDLETSERVIYNMIYLERYTWANKLYNSGSLLKFYSSFKLQEFAQSDMSLFVFMMECLETNQFRKGLTMGMEGVNDILEVIRTEVKSKRPDLIRIEELEYRNKAIIFADLVLANVETGNHVNPEVLDAYFQCEDYPDGYIMRFYKDSIVQYGIVNMSLDYIDHEKVLKWFNKNHASSKKSVYRFSNNRITFKIKINSEDYYSYRCDFVSKDEILMEVENSVTKELTSRTFYAREIKE